jgi:hypothetical protein
MCSPSFAHSCPRRSELDPRRPVDEQQIQTVADSEPVEARLDEGLRLRRVGSSPDIEDPAALGVCQRPYAVRCRLLRERCRRLAAAAQDHERQHVRQGDEDPRSFPVRRSHETDRFARQSGIRECRAEHLVHEHRDRSEGGAARAKDDAVQRLEQLSGDVNGDVRPRLEVRADGADRDTQDRDAESVLELPRIFGTLERRQRRELRKLLAERGNARIIESQTVERTFVELRGLHILGIRCRDRVPPLHHELCSPFERARHAVIGQRGDRVRRSCSLALDLLPHPVFRSPAAMPAIDRSSGGTTASSPFR